MGGGHDVLTIHTAQEELVKRALLKNVAHATAEHLQHTVEYIHKNNPPALNTATGLPDVAPFTATVPAFVGQDDMEISKTVHGEQFFTRYPQVTAIRNLHITLAHIVNQPELTFMCKLQQWAFSSLQALCVSLSLDRLTSTPWRWSPHRQFDITARDLQVEASLYFWYREDNELADLLSHGPVALQPFLDLLRYEGFDADRAVRVDLAPISRNIQPLLCQLGRDRAKGRHSLGGAAYAATATRDRV